MDIVRLIFEFSGKLVLNNDFVTENSPMAIDWFRGSDLIVGNQNSVYIFNTKCLDSFSFPVYEINPNHFVICMNGQNDVEKAIRVTHASTHFIFPRRFVVEVGQGKLTSFFTIFAKESEKFAVDLKTRVLNPTVTLENSKIILRDDGVDFAYDPVKNEVLEHNVHGIDKLNMPLPFAFLHYLKIGDFKKARELLSFNIGEEQLKKYFGEFDVLLNNYLEDENVVTIIQNRKPRSLRFAVVDDKIENIN